MSPEHIKAIETINDIIKDMKLKLLATEIHYRNDYEDYQVLFSDTHHCEIQAKSVDDFIKFKNSDAKRQIQFQLNHPFAWEEWEKPSGGTPDEEGMSVDPNL